jgi:hypothetical protein
VIEAAVVDFFQKPHIARIIIIISHHHRLIIQKHLSKNNGKTAMMPRLLMRCVGTSTTT